MDNQNPQNSNDDLNKPISKQLPYSSKQLLVLVIMGGLMYLAYRFLTFYYFIIAFVFIILIGGEKQNN